MGQVDGWGLRVPSYPTSPAVNSAGSGNTVRHITESAEHFPTESPSVLCITSDPVYKPKVQVGGERDWSVNKMRSARDKRKDALKQERLDAPWTKVQE
jgi:hypothetical protein